MVNVMLSHFGRRHPRESVNFMIPLKAVTAKLKKLRILRTAAKVIKSDVKSMPSSKTEYPGTNQMSSVELALGFLPESLRVLLELLLTGQDISKKVASIGQAIVQAIRPRVIIMPLQLGLAVEMHHHFASRYLIDTLNEHGFCSPCHEVQRFERNAAVTSGTDVPNYTDSDYIQYIADNVDHNVRTIDGYNTFHGMGMLGVITPAKQSTRTIPRVTVTNEDILAVGRVNIHHMSVPCTGLQNLKYQKLSIEEYHDKDCDALDNLWNISLHLRSPRPAWSGMMQAVHKGPHPGPASMLFLPMIDMDPGNLTCIFSSLQFICNHARQYNVKPMITFDQPLWLKSLEVIESQPDGSEFHDIILQLGGFHTLMSFLGCIGHIMAGSGLQYLLEQVYAGTTVKHMLTGKAYSRAVRGHLLVAAALHTMITAMALNIPYHMNHPQRTKGSYFLSRRRSFHQDNWVKLWNLMNLLGKSWGKNLPDSILYQTLTSNQCLWWDSWPSSGNDLWHNQHSRISQFRINKFRTWWQIASNWQWCHDGPQGVRHLIWGPYVW